MGGWGWRRLRELVLDVREAVKELLVVVAQGIVAAPQLTNRGVAGGSLMQFASREFSAFEIACVHRAPLPSWLIVCTRRLGRCKAGVGLDLLQRTRPALQSMGGDGRRSLCRIRCIAQNLRTGLRGRQRVCLALTRSDP